MSKAKRSRLPALSVREQVAIARDRAVDTTVAIFLTVLCDKEHADAEIIRRVWGEVNAFLKRVLREEHEIGVD